MADYNSSHTGKQIDDGIDLAHSHSNKSILDGITQQNIATWDSKADATDIPSKVSDLTNDSGFISTETDPTVPNCIKNVTQSQIDGWDDATAKKHTHTNKGVLDGISAAQVTGWVQAASLSHSHENISTLDLITSSKWTTVYNNTHSHSNKSTLDGIQSTDVANWNDANTKKHTHTNQAVIDGITSTDVAKWNAAAASGFSGNYNDLYNKPTIPSKESDLVHDMNYLTEETEFKGSTAYGITSTNVSNWNDANSKKHTHANSTTLNGISDDDTASWDAAADAAHSHSNKSVLDGITSSKVSSWDSKANVSDIPTSTSDLTNDSGFITSADLPIVPTKVSDLTNDSGFQNSTDVSSAITSALDALDIDASDNAWISGITQTNGKISGVYFGAPETLSNFSGSFNDNSLLVAGDGVSPYKPKKITGSSLWSWISGKLPASSSTWGSITGTLSDQTDLKNALDAKATPADITAAINNLNKSGSPSTNQYISIVRQSAGIIDVQKATLPMHTAGNGISVSSGTVSAKLGSGLSFDANGAIQVTGGASWGSITGTLSSQTDLQSALDAKQDKLIAGAGITIAADGKTISSTSAPAATSWGSITGTLSDQTDLKDALDVKANSSDIPTWVGNVTSLAVQGKLTTNLPDILQYHVTAVSAVDANGSISGHTNAVKRLSSTVVTTGDDDLITKSGFNSWVTKLGGVQKKLTAGSNITIAADGTISATGGGGSVAFADITGEPTDNADLQAYFNDVYQVMGSVTLSVNTKQDILVPGTGITIAADGKTISSSTAWGSITGDIADQTDFMEYYGALVAEVGQQLANKQDTLIAGTGITIAADGKTISVTGGSSSYSSGNRVVITSSSQFSSLTANTCYEINQDFSVSGTYTIPEGVSFFFAGGSISGGTWNCPGDADYTAYWRDRSKRPRLLGDVKFNKANYNMTWNGGFANDEVDFEWFNPSHSNASNSNADLVAALVGQLHDQVLNIGDMYPITKPITITTGSATIQSKNQFQGGYAAFTASCSAGFYITGKLFSAIVLSDGRINLKGITLLGATGFTNKNRSTPWALYGSRNAHNDNTAINVTLYDRYFKSYTLNSGASGSEYPNSANFCGLDLQHGSVELVEDCCFNGFCRGISLDATKTWSSGTPGFFNRCFISTCKWGVFVANTSDFFFTNCKINSCNSDCVTGLSGSTGRNIKAQGQYNTSTHRHEDYGGGVYISASNMIQFDACRWEFNYMGIYLDNACSNINFTGGIFDRCTHSVMTIYNAVDHYITSDQFPDRHNPAVCGVNFTGNNILRGVGSRTDWDSSSPSLTPGVAYFCVCSRPDSSTDAWVTRTDGLRKLDLHIAANTFEDNMEMAFDGVSSHTGVFNPQNLTYEKSIFMFDCTDNGGVDINFSGNDFSASKATYFSESYNSSSSAGKGYATIKGGNNSYPVDMDFSVPYYHSTDARKNAQVARLNEIAFEDGSIVTYDTTLGGGKRPLRWKGTLAQYNALATHYDDTDYLITE